MQELNWLPWENNQNFPIPPLVSPHDVRETSPGNSILMTRHYPDLGSASDWLNQISHVARPVRSTTQIWEVMHHQYGISALISWTSFGGQTSGSVAKSQLAVFSGYKLSHVCFLTRSGKWRGRKDYPQKHIPMKWINIDITNHIISNIVIYSVNNALHFLTRTRAWFLKGWLTLIQD